MSAALHGPAPTASPQNAAEARARLQTISADEKWRSRYLNGGVAEREEFARLTDQIAQSPDGAPEFLIETVDSITDRDALPKAGYESLMDGMRENVGGLPNDVENYMRALNRGETTLRPTEGDGLVARETLERLMKNNDWCQRVMNNDPIANQQMNALTRTISYAATDGKPVTETTTKWIADNIWSRMR
jgi:hypothetical protein